MRSEDQGFGRYNRWVAALRRYLKGQGRANNQDNVDCLHFLYPSLELHHTLDHKLRGIVKEVSWLDLQSNWLSIVSSWKLRDFNNYYDATKTEIERCQRQRRWVVVWRYGQEDKKNLEYAYKYHCGASSRPCNYPCRRKVDWVTCFYSALRFYGASLS